MKNSELHCCARRLEIKRKVKYKSARGLPKLDFGEASTPIGYFELKLGRLKALFTGKSRLSTATMDGLRGGRDGPEEEDVEGAVVPPAVGAPTEEDRAAAAAIMGWRLMS